LQGRGLGHGGTFLAHQFNRPDFPIVDYGIYGFVSDGDMMEGISANGFQAGHLGLGRLVYIYLDNKISIEGSTKLAFTETWRNDSTLTIGTCKN
jgi:transketolase